MISNRPTKMIRTTGMEIARAVKTMKDVVLGEINESKFTITAYTWTN